MTVVPSSLKCDEKQIDILVVVPTRHVSNVEMAISTDQMVGNLILQKVCFFFQFENNLKTTINVLVHCIVGNFSDFVSALEK